MLQAVVTGCAGIIAGLIYAVGGMFHDLLTVGFNHGTVLAFLAIPIMPLYFAIFGFVCGLVGAYLYNTFLSSRIHINMNAEK